MPTKEQPDASERLEAWQAEDPETRSYRLRRILTGGCLVELERHQIGRREEFVWAVDSLDVPGYKPDKRIALAKEPGLLATIEAALDQWEKVNDE